MAAPVIPQNLSVQQANGQVYLSWDQSAGATEYNIYRSADNVSFSNIDSSTTLDFVDDTVTLDAQYWYKITATNGTDESGATAVQTVVPTLSGTESLLSLRLQAQQRADRVNSNFVTKAEWNKYINQSMLELYDLLVTQFEDYYMAEPYVFVTDGSDSYTLPDGIITSTVDSVQTKPFYKLLGVDLGLGNNNNAKVTIHKFDFVERNRYVYPNVTSTFFGVFNMRYRVMGNKIRFIPVPGSGQYVTMWYIPRLELLMKDSDTVDAVSGWSEYIIIDAAIKALQKEESDVSVLAAEKAFMIKRIEDAAMNRDAGQPDVISNTRGWSGRQGQGGGPGYDGSFGGY